MSEITVDRVGPLWQLNELILNHIMAFIGPFEVYDGREMRFWVSFLGSGALIEVRCDSEFFTDFGTFLGAAFHEQGESLVQVGALDLSRCDLGDEAGVWLFRALCMDNALKSLDASRNGFGSESCMMLCQCLRTNRTLEMLNLDSNKLFLKHPLEFPKALAHNNTIKGLSLAHNYLGTGFGSELAKALGKGLGQLEHLLVGRNSLCNIGTCALVEVLSVNNNTLKTLSLKDNNIWGPAIGNVATFLQKNQTLTFLDLSKNNVGQDGSVLVAQALKVNTSLTHLNLSDTNLNNQAGAAIGEALTINSTLTHLDLSENVINLHFPPDGDDGWWGLADSLASNRGLQSLDLSYNNLDAEWGLALGEALGKNQTLRNLDIQNNDLGRRGINYLIPYLNSSTTIEHVYLSGNGIEKLSKLRNLKRRDVVLL